MMTGSTLTAGFEWIGRRIGRIGICAEVVENWAWTLKGMTDGRRRTARRIRMGPRQSLVGFHHTKKAERVSKEGCPGAQVLKMWE